MKFLVYIHIIDVNLNVFIYVKNVFFKFLLKIQIKKLKRIFIILYLISRNCQIDLDNFLKFFFIYHLIKII